MSYKRGSACPAASGAQILSELCVVLPKARERQALESRQEERFVKQAQTMISRLAQEVQFGLSDCQGHRLTSSVAFLKPKAVKIIPNPAPSKIFLTFFPQNKILTSWSGPVPISNMVTRLQS